MQHVNNFIIFLYCGFFFKFQLDFEIEKENKTKSLFNT